MILAIPTSDVPFYTQRTDLGRLDYLLTFVYNQREACWYLTLADIQETVLVSGVKIVCDWDLLQQKSDLRLPPGFLMAISNTLDNTPPDVDELGEGLRVQLYYFTTDELV